MTHNTEQRPWRTRTKHPLAAVCAAIVLAGCSGQPSKPVELSEQAYHKQAQTALKDDDLLDAIDALKKLDTRYPFGEYAKHAQLELMYAYLRSSELDKSLATAERFIRLNPDHKQIDYAYYIRALANYELSYSFYERYLSDEDTQRDPLPLKETFNYFSELVQRFPNSQYLGDARQRMVHLRELLAQHELHAARYYMKRHAYLAAANRCNTVLLNFQHTHAIADALAIQIEAYDALKLKQKAFTSLELLQNNYPKHPQLKKNGEFKSRDLASVDRPSLRRFFSFRWIN